MFESKVLDKENLTTFIENIQQASLEEPKDCDQVDIRQLEQVGQNVVNNIHEYVINVDLSKAQFDADLLFEEAARLGMDFGDLKEYGFHVNSSACGGKQACLNVNSFKNMDDALSRFRLFNNKFMEQGAGLYRRAQCHPEVRRNTQEV